MICMAQRRQGGWQALTVVAILTLNRRHNDCVAERFFFRLGAHRRGAARLLPVHVLVHERRTADEACF